MNEYQSIKQEQHVTEYELQSIKHEYYMAVIT